MKLLASDYDNTLNFKDYPFILKINIKAINNFVKNNKFVLNTGRSYESIKNEIKKMENNYNLKLNYDYLSCCDGNLILKKDDTIIYCNKILKETHNDILKLKEKHDIEINPVIFDGKYLEYEIIASLNNINFNLELGLTCLRNNLAYKETYRYILNSYKLKKARFIYVGKNNISKSSAVKMVSKLENIRKCDIFTIGDEFNDIDMLKDFNGYTFPWCKKEVKDVSKGMTLSVASLIKKINR